MLYREIIAVCSEIHTKHINTVCGQNAELLNVKPGGTYSDHCTVHILTIRVCVLWRNTNKTQCAALTSLLETGTLLKIHFPGSRKTMYTMLLHLIA